MSSSRALTSLVREIEACRVCVGKLPHEPRPVVWVDSRARILIAGQAPGRRVHESGIPWNDASGDRLRTWMELDRDRFYDKGNIAVAAMGFCFPGTVNGADLPPRRECAPLWRDYPADVMSLPHPSWRNTGWLKRNPWFERDLLPELRRRVSSALR